MRALGAAIGVGLLAATVSCAGEHDPGLKSDTTASYRGCSSSDLTSHGTRVARADLDADGHDDSILLVGSGRCAGSLVAVGEGIPIGVDVRGLRLVRRPAQVVHLRGGDLVLIRSRVVGNGMFQPHLFGQVDRRLREVTRAGGDPVLPLLRAQRRQAPHAATCTPDGGIEVTESTPHHPPGIVLAWDVTTTTYDVRAGRAVEQRTRVLKAVAEPVLQRQQPDLYAGALFENCH